MLFHHIIISLGLSTNLKISQETFTELKYLLIHKAQFEIPVFFIFKNFYALSLIKINYGTC